jgi:hypothetical protein
VQIVIHITHDKTANADAPGPNVHVDPQFHPIIQTTKGPQPASTARIIGHELGHAVTGTKDDGPDHMNNVKQNENPIAKSMGEPARTKY